MSNCNVNGYEGPVPEDMQIELYDENLFDPTKKIFPGSDYAMAIGLHDMLLQTSHELSLADHDPKSGLPGKLTFQSDVLRHVNRLEQIWKDPREKRKHGLYMWRLDGDDMKELNTVFGPEITDEIFAELGIYIREQFRPTDGVYRPNRTGDEFWVLVTTSGSNAKEQMQEKANALFRKIRHAGVMHGSGHTFSIGIAEYLSGMGIDRFIDAANHAQELAKATKNMPGRPSGYIVSELDNNGNPIAAPIVA